MRAALRSSASSCSRTPSPEEYGAVVAEGGGWPSRRARARAPRLRRERGRRAHAAQLERSRGARRRLGVRRPARGAARTLRATRPGASRRSSSARPPRRGDHLRGRPDASRSAASRPRPQRRFGLSADDVGTLIAGLEEESREAASMLSLELPAGVSYQLLLEQARHLLVSMSVDAVLQLDETSRTIAVLEREMETLADARPHRRAHRPAEPRHARRVPQPAGAPAPARGPARPPRRDPDRHRSLRRLQRHARPRRRRRGAAGGRRRARRGRAPQRPARRATAARSSASSSRTPRTECSPTPAERLRAAVDGHRDRPRRAIGSWQRHGQLRLRAAWPR